MDIIRDKIAFENEVGGYLFRATYLKESNGDALIEIEKDGGFPTRSCLQLMTPAERAITDAMAEVEKAGASLALTDAVVLLGKARDRVADHMEGIFDALAADSVDGPGLTSNRRTAWMVERNSVLWGHEWFCSGKDRWTKDPHKTIQFPDEASAKETWLGLSGRDVPYDDSHGGEWVYTYNVTEHVWM